MNFRKVVILILAVVFCLGAFAACGPKESTSVPDAAGGAAQNAITSEEAKEIALNHAAVSAADATFVRAEYEWDDNSYEVEFYANNVEYDYEINAATGDILSYDSEIEGFVIGDAPQGETASAGMITEEDAKSIALKHSGFSESDVKGLRVTRDRDDGRQEYEVEFRDGFTEYSYEIDATTGEIISYEIDND